MDANLRYAATYLRFRHPCYVRRSLLAYRSLAARPSPLQRSYRAKGCRLVFVLDALTPEAEPPTAEQLAQDTADNLPF